MQNNDKVKKRSLFNPDDISTQIDSAISRDYRHHYLFEHCDDDHGVRDVRTAHQLNSVLKRYKKLAVDQRPLELKAFSTFKQVNRRMRVMNHLLSRRLPTSWPRDGSSTHSHVLWQRVMLSAKALVKQVLGRASLEEIFELCQHGTGSSLDTSFIDTSLEAKVSRVISTTPRARRLYSMYLRWDSTHREAIMQHNGYTPMESVLTEVDGSRATTVDKTTDKRRMIAIEPTANMYLQQGIMLSLYARLRQFGLDVGNLPERHRSLVRRASRDNSLATIDFTSASDTVSLELVKWILPLDWFSLIYDTRCDYMSIDGNQQRLHMVSTMGNAVTFPLETLILYALACATHYHKTKRHANRSCFIDYDCYKACSVFGDDCIVPNDSSIFFMKVCESVGFIVNHDKSYFGNEYFRESCGSDCYHGHDVRPYSFRSPHSLKTSALEPWLYTVWNNHITKYIQHFGDLSYVYDMDLHRVMVRLFRRFKLLVKVVPDDFPDDAGLKIGNDLWRFAECYPEVRFSRLVKDDTWHAVRFQYCHFRYAESKDWNPSLRYSVELKKLHNRSSPNLSYLEKLRNEVRHLYPIRKKGGYVVATSCSSLLDISLTKKKVNFS